MTDRNDISGILTYLLEIIFFVTSSAVEKIELSFNMNSPRKPLSGDVFLVPRASAYPKIRDGPKSSGFRIDRSTWWTARTGNAWTRRVLS